MRMSVDAHDDYNLLTYNIHVVAGTLKLWYGLPSRCCVKYCCFEWHSSQTVVLVPGSENYRSHCLRMSYTMLLWHYSVRSSTSSSMLLRRSNALPYTIACRRPTEFQRGKA
jgi:hypothetical protein